MRVPPAQPVVRCFVALRELEPPVWRRLLVPGGIRLDKLHRIFQATMGWEDRHLHAFRVDGALYGTQFDDYPAEELDEKSATLISAIGEVDHFVYEYDFGDSWEHEVTVEAVWRMPIGLKPAAAATPANVQRRRPGGIAKAAAAPAAPHA